MGQILHGSANCLAILHALIFDCLNYASGRLDPSYATIARLSAALRATTSAAGSLAVLVPFMIRPLSSTVQITITSNGTFSPA